MIFCALCNISDNLPGWVETRCGHAFHAVCMEEYLKQRHTYQDETLFEIPCPATCPEPECREVVRTFLEIPWGPTGAEVIHTAIAALYGWGRSEGTVSDTGDEENVIASEELPYSAGEWSDPDDSVPSSELDSGDEASYSDESDSYEILSADNDNEGDKSEFGSEVSNSLQEGSVASKEYPVDDIATSFRELDLDEFNRNISALEMLLKEVEEFMLV